VRDACVYKRKKIVTHLNYWAGPYYPLGIIGTVSRAYDMFTAYEGMEGRKIKIKKLKI
jgi:hypothetical protein